MECLMKRIKQLEYQQKILLKMIHPTGHEFDRLIISCSLTEEEVNDFFLLCEKYTLKLKEEKAESYYVYYAPLYHEFIKNLNPKLKPEIVIPACVKQNLFPELMKVLEKNI